MKLRKLEDRDAELMLEWIHDSDVVNNLHTNFFEKTIEKVIKFIHFSNEGKSSDINLAIASDSDEYMGTVSLKNINEGGKNAEFAIVVRKEAMGRGYSWFAMREIIEYAFEELKLDSVYWCVSKSNKRAIRFYDKHGFKQTFDISNQMSFQYDGNDNLKWYSILKGDDFLNNSISRGTVADCKVIRIQTIPTVGAGELSYFESSHDIPFEIKRIYYISKVPEGERRGFHAHKKLKQLLFCPYGKVQLVLDDGKIREEITLSDPSIGVLIDKPVWREMLWIEKNSVLCVAASNYYETEDYIREYEDFQKHVKKDY